MAYTAADVKRLREETDAPMMECKAALDEANGDFDRAKAILREKGKAAAAKRADRATGAGIVAVANGESAIAAIVVECETDFVSSNADFKAAVQGMANTVLEKGSAGLSTEDALALTDASGKSLKDTIEELVGKIRENIVLTQVMKLAGGSYGFYVHHDGKQGAVVELSDKHDEVGRNLGMQIVSLQPEYLHKDNLPQDRIAKELEIEIERAMQEGKPREMAEKIATGRVNKEFVKSAVLLEQGFFKDPGKSVNLYITETAGDLQVKSFFRLKIGG